MICGCRDSLNRDNNVIKKIRVDNLFNERTIEWDIKHQVNILSGGNGTGKSTVLRSVFKLLHDGELAKEYLALFDKLEIELDDGRIISSSNKFDTNSLLGKVYSNIYSPIQLTELPSEKALLYTGNNSFCSTVDEYIQLTRKTIVRNSETLQFRLSSGLVLPFELLSSGEKELIKMMFIAYTAKDNDLVILDEPENSLHFDWQKNLINSFLKALPNTKIILTTHSPAMIMNGWVANVDNIDKLIVSASN